MKVISVNVGLPQEVEWNGRKVQTSIFKKPVSGRVRVTRLDLDGNGQADLVAHGGEHRAVMVYQIQSYDYWRKFLQRDDLVYGNFGENLTVDGLADEEVCIGDRYRIGTAVFEVTQPRVTCYKVGISLGVPEMPALLVAHKRPGFYFRVISEGELGAGDDIEKLTDGPGRMSVANVDQLLYSKAHPKDQLVEALKIPALSKGWQLSFNQLLSAVAAGDRSGNAGLSGTQSRPAWPGYRPLRVRHTQLESASIRSFELESEDGTPLPPFLPGQHLAIRVPYDPAQPPEIRMYSLSGPPEAPTYRIAIKRETAGRCSNFLHDNIKPGDLLEASAPRGSFILKAGSAPVILLSAGVGITPMLAMLYSIRQNNPDRPAWWIHSAQNSDNHSFPDEIRLIAKLLTSFHSLVIYSRPGAGDQQGLNYDISGHLNQDILRKLSLPDNSEYYLCGPSAYLTETIGSLKSLGIAGSQIHFETFGQALPKGNGKAPHLPADNTGAGPIITFTKSNISFRWNEKCSSILAAAEAADIPVRWSCRTGVCHLCESGLLDGSVTYSPDPLDPPADGNLLICCSRPLTPISLDL